MISLSGIPSSNISEKSLLPHQPSIVSMYDLSIYDKYVVLWIMIAMSLCLLYIPCVAISSEADNSFLLVVS